MSKRSVPYGHSCRVPRGRVEWCHNCRAGDHSKCNGRRIKKYERGYAPCECAAQGHGRTT